MRLFTDGITITDNEHKCLLYLETDPEKWLLDSITDKARLRRDALINDWRPRLFGDPAVTELPADPRLLARLIMARDDYKSRAAADAVLEPPEYPTNYNLARYNAVNRRGATVTLFPSGITLEDWECNCILAYVQSLPDWVLGALLGQINRGRKLMFARYGPIILGDPSVKNIRATENGFISAIVSRSDYQNRAARDSATPTPVR